MCSASKKIQDKGTYNEHFDICQSKKAKALLLGAKQITLRELSTILRARPGHPFHENK